MKATQICQDELYWLSQTTSRMQKILVFGGTQFIGKTIVEKLVSLGQYEITLFNRGKTNSAVFQSLNQIKGDREADDVAKISADDWDYVIDVSCYYPNSMNRVIQALKSVKRYIFISTCSVYDNGQYKGEFRNETAPILSCSESEMIDTTPASYGQRKAECERILKTSGLDHVIFRPALVYGPHDYTDRLYYWLYQVKHNDPILLPNNGTSKFSLTYVHDLAQLVVNAITIQTHQNVYTATSHPGSSIKAIVESAARTLNQQPKYINASQVFLREQNVAQWSEMPLWLDTNDFTYDNSKVKMGLDFTPTAFDQSIQETIAFFGKKGWPLPEYGINEERRRALLSQLSNAA